jgi:hypothetical protein
MREKKKKGGEPARASEETCLQDKDQGFRNFRSHDRSFEIALWFFVTTDSASPITGDFDFPEFISPSC